MERMERAKWLEAIRVHLAMASVGGSTLRSQVKPGGVQAARKFLKNFPIKNLANLNEKKFSKLLNQKTTALSKNLLRPDNNEPNFGAARKVLNIFLRHCAMNKDLHRKFKLKAVDKFLEVPLDSYVVKGIDKNFARGFKIKTLTPYCNSVLQEAAMKIARRKKLHRYELDVLFWGHDV